MYGTLSKMANSYDVHSRTVSRIWRRARASRTYLCAVNAVRSRLKSRKGRPRANVDTICAALKSTPLFQHTTLRNAAAALGIAKTTLRNVLTLQKCMETFVFKNGDNTYRLQHMAKSRRRRKNEHIDSIQCSPAAFNLARNIVKEA